MSVRDKLDQLASLYGKVSTGQVSIRVRDLSTIDKVMIFVRTMPAVSFEGVLKKQDLLNSQELRTDAVILSNEKAKLIFRPSGTEPKLKCYLQYRGADMERLKDFASDLLRSAQQSA
jgi:phosphomannomutase